MNDLNNPTLDLRNLSPGDLEKLKERMARDHLVVFAREFIRGPPEPPFDGRFMVSDTHKRWSKLINTSDRLNILAARGFGKSHFFSIAYPIWKAWKNPGKRILLLSGNKDQVSRILLDIQKELEENPKLEFLLPKTRKKKRWSSSQMVLANGAEIYSAGYRKKVRGGHPVAIVLDDILNDEDSFSPTVRKRNIKYFFTAIIGMAIPGTQVVLVGTPLHVADLYGIVSKRPGFICESFPAIIEDAEGNEASAWPEGRPLEWLQLQRAGMSSLQFDQEYRCRPATDAGSLFPTELLNNATILRDDFTLGGTIEKWRNSSAQIKSAYTGIDLGLAAKDGDYTVIWTVGLDAQGNRWVMDIQRARGMAFNEQLDLIKSVHARFRQDLIYIEANQAQRIFGETLQHTTSMPIRLFHTSSEKHSLVKGIPAMRMPLENGKYRLPRGDARSVELTDQWIEEMNAFAVEDGQAINSAPHDDCAMASYVCERAIELGGSGFSFSFGYESELQTKLVVPTSTLSGLGQNNGAQKAEPIGTLEGEDFFGAKPLSKEAENKLRREWGIAAGLDLEEAQTENRSDNKEFNFMNYLGFG